MEKFNVDNNITIKRKNSLRNKKDQPIIIGLSRESQNLVPSY